MLMAVRADSQTTVVNAEATVAPTSPFKGLPSSPIRAVLSLPSRIVNYFASIIYVAIQYVLAWTFAPPPPPHGHGDRKPFGRIAVIGAGLTGVSSAAHCIAHGFEVVIFESKNETGGIWADVNKCVSLSKPSARTDLIWSASQDFGLAVRRKNRDAAVLG